MTLSGAVRTFGIELQVRYTMYRRGGLERCKSFRFLKRSTCYIFERHSHQFHELYKIQIQNFMSGYNSSFTTPLAMLYPYSALPPRVRQHQLSASFAKNTGIYLRAAPFCHACDGNGNSTLHSYMYIHS